jgi:branched-subunit amino acid transport protein
MKNTVCNALSFLVPAAIFALIIHDGLTLKTAHHSGTQPAITHTAYK